MEFIMNKRKLLKQKLDEIKKQYDDLEVIEQQKIGAFVLALYDKGEFQDERIKLEVAKIVGDIEQAKPRVKPATNNPDASSNHLGQEQ